MRGVKPRLVISNEQVKPMAKTPKPPRGMSEAAKAEWNRVVPDLIARGLFTDPPMVANYCSAIAGAGEARAARRGKVMLGGKAHPAVRMEQQYLTIARQYAAEIGLTAVARQRGDQRPSIEGGGDDDWA